MANTVGIKFLYNFCLGDYNYTTPGGNIISITSEADGDHKKVNLTTTPLRETWRSGPNIEDFQEIVIQTSDLTVTPDTFAILNHNLTETAVVQLQASQTPDFLSPAFTITMVWSKKHMILLQDIGFAYNYYRFRILDPLNPCGFLEIGRIIAGKSFTITNNEDITDNISISTDDLAYRMKTEGFFRAFNERVKVDRLSIKFDKLVTTPPDDVNYAGLMEMFEEVGETYSFLTILDPDDQTFKMIWGVIDNLPNKGFTINRYVDMSFAIQEMY